MTGEISLKPREKTNTFLYDYQMDAVKVEPGFTIISKKMAGV